MLPRRDTMIVGRPADLLQGQWWEGDRDLGEGGWEYHSMAACWAIACC